MRKTILSLILLASLCGCGGSGGSDTTTAGLDGRLSEGNFILVTTDVERRFVYVLNRAANTLSAVLLAEEEEGGHGHAHARFLAQQEEEEHLEFDEIEGSPYSLGLTLVDFIVSSDGAFAHILDNSGRLTTFSIDQVTGLITRTNELNTPVANPRTLKLSDDGQVLAVLGDTVFIAPLNDDGTLGTSATIAGTANWLDLVIRQGSGAASTAGGAVGFAWTPGAAVVPHGETALPGATRGQLGYLGEQIFVVNQADTSVTRLDQDATTGALTLSRTFDLPAQLTDPNLMLPIFDGEDLLIADSNSLVLSSPRSHRTRRRSHDRAT